jgi:hypothetical protein
MSLFLFPLISVSQFLITDALAAKIIAFHFPDERHFIFAIFIHYFSASFEWRAVQKQGLTMQ